MKKIVIFALVLFIIVFSACSNTKNVSTKTVNNDSPAYIQESFKYYHSMTLVIEAVKDRKNLIVAYDKYFENEPEAIQWIIKSQQVLEKAGPDAKEEERAVVQHIEDIRRKLSFMYLQEKNKPGWSSERLNRDLNDIRMPLEQLKGIYGKYGYKPKE